MQRKFTRKPTGPKALLSPIINFEDYTRTMTPLDRYRKHYLIFDYWNDELIASLQSPPLNPKRYKRASTESLTELGELQRFVTEDLAPRFTPLIEERSKLDRQFQRGTFNDTDASRVIRTLETNTRQIQRDFFWRNVQDHLQSEAPSP